ncbi:MAG: 28S ribosomal protein S5, mitochondrial [Thelocarpon superellum]|nr:MAG: 28S ribosomal protein S5, mitochondrial [Thelocarpon superellum]
MGLARRERSNPYTAEEKKLLADKYTPAQLQALEAGEAAIDESDLQAQAALRDDPMALKYLDDFATIRPIIDKPARDPNPAYDPKLRLKTKGEVAEDLWDFVKNFPNDTKPEDAKLPWMKFMHEQRMTVGKEEVEKSPTSYQTPELPKISDPNITYPPKRKAFEDPEMKRVFLYTGFTPDVVKDFRIKTLVLHSVVNQTRMGKQRSMYCLTVAGDGRGLVGIGEGKSLEPEDARAQSRRAAIRNMHAIPRYEGRTIFGEVEGKVGAAEVTISSRPPGFGVRSQQHIFEICRCAGITDMAARVTRSRNPMNVIKATMEALKNQRIPEEIAIARGKKLVDVRKVYYGGNV